jgi:predicted alpha/beta-hydrolase family hydrolase
MLAADEKDLVSGLLLLSYPLHPPRRPLEMRTAHFPKLATPSLFVHGSRDPFGSIDELRLAMGRMSASSQLLEIFGSGHELLPRGADNGLPGRVVGAFREFFA